MRIILMLLVISLFTGVQSYAQRPDSQENETNAIDYRYQPHRSRKVAFSQTRSFLDRSYLLVGLEAKRFWGYDELVDNGVFGVGSRIAVGTWLTPTHGLEIGASFGVLPYPDWRADRLGNDYFKTNFADEYGIELNYMFNLSAYSLGQEQISPWQFILITGVNMKRWDKLIFGLNAAIRCQFNPSPDLGLFIEPKVSIFDSKLGSQRVNDFGIQFTPAISAGLVLRKTQSASNRNQFVDDGEGPVGFMLAVKTNLLHWTMATPNISVEIPISNSFSVSVDYAVPWFRNRPAGFTYQMNAGLVEGRYWFDKDTSLEGHFVGINIGAGYYDVQHREKGIQGEFITSGLSYGYVWPITERLSLELSTGAGVLRTVFRKYEPEDGCLVYKATKKFDYFGITRANVSVSWKIGKGGQR